MKTQNFKIIVVILILCLGHIKTSNAQQWGSPQVFGGINPSVTTNLYDVFFTPSGIYGYIVGDNGTILATTDGGLNWVAQVSGTTNSLRKVYFANDTSGLACGMGGTILKTTNGGATWQPITSGTTSTLFTLYYNGSFGIVGGSSATLLKTTNGGVSWSTVTNPFTSTGITDISVPTSSNTNFWWVATGNQTVGYTLDGGVNWTVSGGPPGPSAAIQSMHARSATVIWRIAGNILQNTTNQGGLWSTPSATFTYTLNDVHFANQTSVFGHAVGANGTIISTTNGGSTWTIETSTTTQFLRSVFMLNGVKGFAVGNNGTVLLYRATSTGVKNEIKEDYDDLIFPNPATSQLNAEIPFKPQSIKMYDVAGKQVIETNTFPINTSELENGVYFMEIHSENEMIRKKIIVTK